MITPMYSIFGQKAKKFFPMQAEYQAVLNQATALGFTLPDAEQQRLDNNVVYYLKREGIWSELDLLYVFQRNSFQSDFAKLNWINPSSFKLESPTPNTFTNNIGFSSGAGQYLNTGYIPSIHGIKAKLNDACYFYKATGTGTYTSVYGTRNSSGNNLWKSGAAMYFNYSTGTGALTTALTGHVFDVKNGTTQKGYNNGSLVATATKVSSSLSTVPLLLFALNNGGSVINITPAGYSKHYFGCGSSAIETRQLELWKILNNLYE